MADLDTTLWLQNRIFAAAGRESCARLAKRYPARLYQPGEVVAKVGDAADALHVLLAGTVRIYQETPDGRQNVVKLMRAPNVFGDIELLHALDFLENVAAIDAIRVARIPAADYQAFLDRYPAATRRHLEHVAAAFCVVARNERATLAPLEERLANLLLSYAELFGQVDVMGNVFFARPLSQPEMAASLGVTVRAVAQVLAGWRREGLISKKERELFLRDVEALRELARPIAGSLRYEMGMSLDHLARGGGQRQPARASLRIAGNDTPLAGLTFPIDGEVIVGSQVPSHLRLPDEALDAQHCRVFRATTGGKLWVEDLQSKGGTYLRGKKVTRAVLKDGDELWVGRTTLVVCLS